MAPPSTPEDATPDGAPGKGAGGKDIDERIDTGKISETRITAAQAMGEPPAYRSLNGMPSSIPLVMPVTPTLAKGEIVNIARHTGTIRDGFSDSFLFGRGYDMRGKAGAAPADSGCGEDAETPVPGVQTLDKTPQVPPNGAETTPPVSAGMCGPDTVATPPANAMRQQAQQAHQQTPVADEAGQSPMEQEEQEVAADCMKTSEISSSPSMDPPPDTNADRMLNKGVSKRMPNAMPNAISDASSERAAPSAYEDPAKVVAGAGADTAGMVSEQSTSNMVRRIVVWYTHVPDARQGCVPNLRLRLLQTWDDQYIGVPYYGWNRCDGKV